MASIHTLIADIYAFQSQSKGGYSPEEARLVFEGTESRLVKKSSANRREGTLRLSGLGPKCPRALWYEINHPEQAEPLPPWAIIKYSYGHILETLVLGWARAAGHLVQGEQDELVVDGIRGHRDAVIDGCVVDVKSCSSIQFAKYKDKSIRENDSFGYLDQLDGYLVGSANDDLVTDKEHGYILAIDKTLGHMCLYEHTVRENSIRERIKHYREIVERSSPPTCNCGTVTDGKSGNIKLDIKASYSPYKYSCFPNLRTFLYADGPRYLTHVARLPDVQEVDRSGKFLYN